MASKLGVIKPLPYKAEYKGSFMEPTSIRYLLSTLQAEKYEYFTTAAWNSILNWYFPLNGDSTFVFSHEHFLNGRPADMVVQEIFDTPDGAVRLAFIVLEFKVQSGFDTVASKKALDQLTDGVKSLFDQSVQVQTEVFGITSAGVNCQFWEYDWKTHNIMALHDDEHEVVMGPSDLVKGWHDVHMALLNIRGRHAENTKYFKAKGVRG